MSRLSAALAERETKTDPISVAIVGVGRIGRSIGIGSEEIDGISVTGVADIKPELGEETFDAMGHPEDDITVVETIAEGEEALAEQQRVVADDALALSRMNGIDVVIAATGVPRIGAKVAMRSILSGKHVVMVTDETDAAIGPYLSRMAAQAGVVYSGAAGDEPGSIMELYDFADALGFEVVAAGKGKNNPLDRTATPESLEAEAEEKNLNPEIYTAFVDGTNSMLEMTMVANATGLSVDQRGMHGPEVSEVAELADVFDSDSEEGVLSSNGVVDFALGGGVAPGVFLVITTGNETIRADLDYLDMGEGPNYILHRTYHIPTIEPLLTAARAVLFGDASLVPQAPVADTITVAKRDLEAGEEIDRIGGHTVYGLTERADITSDEDLVPISIIEGATLETDIDADTPITYDDVSMVDTELFHLRKLQDAYFRS
jgi:predicted homoserine dehydrogenase-like protein